jgi:hypothetical protein
MNAPHRAAYCLADSTSGNKANAVANCMPASQQFEAVTSIIAEAA